MLLVAGKFIYFTWHTGVTEYKCTLTKNEESPFANPINILNGPLNWF